MRLLKLVTVYTALTLGANAVFAENIADLREGSMKKLVLRETIAPAANTMFTHENGSEARLSDYKGKVTVVNFWATWCAPCREEMPALDRLKADMPDINVVTIASGPNPEPAMKRFFAQAGVENLPLHRDSKLALSRAMGVLGLPVTVILDKDGNEIARLTGGAEWDSDSAKAILTALSE